MWGNKYVLFQDAKFFVCVICHASVDNITEGASNADSGNLAWICRKCRRCGFDPWAGKIPLGKEMVIHSSVLSWEISWTEEPGGLQSMGLSESHGWASFTFKLTFPGFNTYSVLAVVYHRISCFPWTVPAVDFKSPFVWNDPAPTKVDWIRGPTLIQTRITWDSFVRIKNWDWIEVFS